MTKRMEGTMRMIVIGADTHKDTHTAVAVADGTGQLVDELTAPARKVGFAQHLDWARGLDSERVWAIEDCRHVSGALERFLVASGERVVRVPPKRHLARRVWQLLPQSEIDMSMPTVDSQRDALTPQIAVTA
jgi:hypothetical protein